MNNSFFKYLNIGAIEEKWGMYITTAGYSKVEPHEAYPNQQHPLSHTLTWNTGRTLSDYYIVFISKGKGIFNSALTKPEEVDAGTCFLLFPDIWHRYKPDIQSGWEEYWVGFHGYYADQLMKQNFFHPTQPCFHLGPNQELLALFNKLTDTVKSSLCGYPLQMAGITMQILALVNTLADQDQPDHHPIAQLIGKAKFLLQESVDTQLDMEELARQLPMGYSAFRKSFKRITGESPHQYQLSLRLNRAKDLLSSSILNINEIAEQTGFESVHYFSKLFKKKTGVSPNTFRKELCFAG